jgi:hypothetical protein
LSRRSAPSSEAKHFRTWSIARAGIEVQRARERIVAAARAGAVAADAFAHEPGLARRDAGAPLVGAAALHRVEHAPDDPLDAGDDAALLRLGDDGAWFVFDDADVFVRPFVVPIIPVVPVHGLLLSLRLLIFV